MEMNMLIIETRFHMNDFARRNSFLDTQTQNWPIYLMLVNEGCFSWAQPVNLIASWRSWELVKRTPLALFYPLGL